MALKGKRFEKKTVDLIECVFIECRVEACVQKFSICLVFGKIEISLYK